MPRRQRRETEGTLKAAIMDRLRKYRGVLPWRLEDTSTSGIPDIVVLARGRTTWWEAKYGDPNYDWGGIQHVHMCQAEQFAYARYIIYRETAEREYPMVYIARPSEIERPAKWDYAEGFNHDWVVQYILRAHL